MSYKIVNLQEDQLSEGLILFSKSMGFTDEISQSFMDGASKYYQNGMFEMIGLYAESEILGFGSISFMKENSWIPFVGVHPDAQGKGYGKKIMEKLIQMLKTNGRETVELCSTDAGYPLYEKLGFSFEYRTDIYNIINTKDFEIQNSRGIIIQTLSKGDPIPDWVIDLDQQIMGVKRKSYLEFQTSEEFVLIGSPNKGFGILSGKRIGPLVAKDEEYAKDLFGTGLDIGMDQVILVDLPNRRNFIHDLVELELFLPCRKMTYGPLPAQQYDHIYTLRSTAFG